MVINNLLSFFYNSSSNSSYFSKYVTPYECGFSSFGAQSSNFSMGFLVLLVFFVLLDVEVVLLLNASKMLTLWGSLLYYLSFLFIIFMVFLFEVLYGFVSFKY
uniref:NADH-ubiquinone oxidoreductase chain 3 n=1 Tax=Sphyranura euryceae TaxID=2996394 RepID=A0AA51UCI7_9PLAT|nr:NADH dehydrogenase subunit 3 [Sphyranura euryceae]WMV02088.1 NADH dehydrogenase subunit 3 [Sphyranura euryceae]